MSALSLFAAPPLDPAPEPVTVYDVIVEWLEDLLGLEFAGPAPLPPEPTHYPPGSPEKQEVIAWRVAHRFQACHPLDNRDMGGLALDRSRNGQDFNPRLVG